MLKELQYQYKIINKNRKYSAAFFDKDIIPCEYQ